MIARPLPYALTPFQAALDSLVARVSTGVAPSGELKTAAGDARDLFESMVAGNPPDRTPADVWTGRYDGRRLTVSGPRVTALASFEGAALASLVLDFPAGSFDLAVDPAGARVLVIDAAGATLAHYRFGADGSVHDENAPPPVLGIDDLFAPPPAGVQEAVEKVAPAPQAPPAPEKQWYYVADGKPEGPLPESDLREKLASLPPATLVWNEELPEWKSAEAAGVAPAPLPAVAVPAAIPPPPAAPEPEPRKWELASLTGAAGPWRLSGEVRIGRSQECEICLADGMASRVHAFVREQPDGFWIADNSSLNGTEVNGARVDNPVRLSGADTIRVGDTELVFRPVQEAVVAAVAEPGPRPVERDAAPAFAPPAPAMAEPAAPLFAEWPAPLPPEPPASIFEEVRVPEPAGGLKFCSDCGGRNHGDSIFCVHCGRRLGA